jgi:hypothetical protein
MWPSRIRCRDCNPNFKTYTNYTRHLLKLRLTSAETDSRSSSQEIALSSMERDQTERLKRWRFRISDASPTILTGVTHGFPQSLQVNIEIIS